MFSPIIATFDPEYFFYPILDAPKVDISAAKVWKLSAMDMNDDDIDLVDDDELLDEEDLKKPDPASLRGRRLNEPRHEKNEFLPMQKQRRRSAVQSLHS